MQTKKLLALSLLVTVAFLTTVAVDALTRIPQEPVIPVKEKEVVDVSQIQFPKIAELNFVTPTPLPTSSITPVPTPKVVITPKPVVKTSAPVVTPKAVVSQPSGCDNYLVQINAIGSKYGVRPSLLKSQLNAESHCGPIAGNPSGSYGCAQINMPSHPNVSVSQAGDCNWSIDWQGQKMGYYVSKYGEYDALRAYNCGDAGMQNADCGVGYAKQILASAQ